MNIIAGQQLSDSLVRNALSGNRGGSSSPGGGYSGSSGNSGDGGFLNALRYGGLFSENNGHGASADRAGNKPRVTVSGAGPGGMISK